MIFVSGLARDRMVHNHQYLMRHRLYTRLLVLVRVYTRAIRARLRSRQTQIMGGGTKRGLSSPCASSSALKVTSVRRHQCSQLWVQLFPRTIPRYASSCTCDCLTRELYGIRIGALADFRAGSQYREGSCVGQRGLSTRETARWRQSSVSERARRPFNEACKYDSTHGRRD